MADYDYLDLTLNRGYRFLRGNARLGDPRRDPAYCDYSVFWRDRHLASVIGMPAAYRVARSCRAGRPRERLGRRGSGFSRD